MSGIFSQPYMGYSGVIAVTHRHVWGILYVDENRAKTRGSVKILTPRLLAHRLFRLVYIAAHKPA